MKILLNFQRKYLRSVAPPYGYPDTVSILPLLPINCILSLHLNPHLEFRSGMGRELYRSIAIAEMEREEMMMNTPWKVKC